MTKPQEYMKIKMQNKSNFLQQKKMKIHKTGVYVNLSKTGTSEVLFVPGYNRWGGGTKDPPPKKLRFAVLK